MDYRFVDCTADAIDEVWNIETDSFSDPWTKNAFYSSLDNPLYTFTLCMDGDKIAGYIVGIGICPEGEIANIAVRSEYRRHNIGSMLLDKYISTAVDKGYNIFFLEVREGNVPARKLYEKYGFKVLGIRKNYYKNPKENAVVMIYEKKSTK